MDEAHPQGNTIMSLGALSSPVMPLLVSGCKGGLLKLWSPETFNNIFYKSIKCWSGWSGFSSAEVTNFLPSVCPQGCTHFG